MPTILAQSVGEEQPHPISHTLTGHCHTCRCLPPLLIIVMSAAHGWLLLKRRSAIGFVPDRVRLASVRRPPAIP